MKTKQFNFLTRALAVTVLFMTSCSDDDKTTSPGYFTIDGNRNAVKYALFIGDTSPSIGPVNGDLIYINELVFFSEGFTVDGEEINGQGNAIRVQLITSTAALEPGTYSFNSNSSTWESGVFSAGGAFLNFNTTSQTGDTYIFSEGTITVTKSGSIYTIEFSGIVSGEAITGKFKGLVPSTLDQ